MNTDEQGCSADERYDFDRIIERGGTNSVKWETYREDVLPLWVADLDFVSPRPVIDALRRRVEHGIFGYSQEPGGLRAVIRQHLARLYSWEVADEDFVFLPGVVTGLNLSCRVVGVPGDEVLIQTPIYPPFLTAPENSGRRGKMVPLMATEVGYRIDFDAFEASITSQTSLFMLCNPHNPTGRVFTRAELERLAEICIAHDVIICSDEIHKDFVYEGHCHIPIASLGTDVANRTITLLAPSKTYNIAGLQMSVALVSNRELRDRLQAACAGLFDMPVGLLGYVAALSAYEEGAEWLGQVLRYLQTNRKLVVSYVRDRLPGIKVVEPEGTYLAWLDCREAGVGDDPARFFLQEARVALSPGKQFGADGEGFVRLNFGSPKEIVVEALDRMARALVGPRR